MNTAVSGVPRSLLRLEGLTVLGAGLVAYHLVAGSWILFIALFLVPDLSALAYLAGPRVGAGAYNAVHTYAAPALLAGAMGIGLLTPDWALALIWTSHIGLDRALGYGLKFSSAFRDTHLGQLGPVRSSA